MRNPRKENIQKIQWPIYTHRNAPTLLFMNPKFKELNPSIKLLIFRFPVPSLRSVNLSYLRFQYVYICMVPICMFPSSFFSCKDKPGVSDKIMARTYNFVCPLTDRIMYEDMSYKSERTDATKTTTKRTHTAEQTQVHKPAKKQKIAKVVKDEKAEKPETAETNDKPFSASQQKQLAKFKTAYEKMVTDFGEDDAHIKDELLATYIPGHLLTKQNAHMVTLNIEVSELDINIEAGAGDFGALKEKHSMTKQTSGPLRNRIKAAMEEAEEAKNEAAAGGA